MKQVIHSKLNKKYKRQTAGKTDQNMINFIAEIVEVRAKKALSLDKEYLVKLVSSDPKAIQLDEYVGTDRVVRISVENEE